MLPFVEPARGVARRGFQGRAVFIHKTLRKDFAVLETLSERMAGLRDHADLLQRFMRFSGLDKDGARDALGPKGNPILLVATLEGATRGRFLTASPAAITLDKGLLGQWSHHPNDASLRDRVVATCLHEMVHWGRYRCGLPAHLCANAAISGPCPVPACRKDCWREAGHAFEAGLAGLLDSAPADPDDDGCVFDGNRPVA